MKKGRIIPNGVELKEHELKTVVFLTEQGFDVELIPIKKQFTFAKRLKRMKIVTKSKKLLEYQK